MRLADDRIVEIELVAGKPFRAMLQPWKDMILRDSNALDLQFVTEPDANAYVIEAGLGDETFLLGIPAAEMESRHIDVEEDSQENTGVVQARSGAHPGRRPAGSQTDSVRPSPPVRTLARSEFPARVIEDEGRPGQPDGGDEERNSGRRCGGRRGGGVEGSATDRLTRVVDVESRRAAATRGRGRGHHAILPQETPEPIVRGDANSHDP